MLAHEIGHVETSKILKNPIDAYTKWRSKGRESNKFREYTEDSRKGPKIVNEDFSGIKGLLKLNRRNRGVNNVLMEEENASKNAKDQMKKLVKKGIMTKSEYDKASENLNIDYETYKNDAAIYKNLAKLSRLRSKKRK